MNIKAILIDIDNTLLDFTQSAKQAAEKTAKKLNVILPENYFPVFNEVNDRLWELLEIAEITKQDIYNRRWPEIFEILGINADGKVFEEEFRNEIRDIAIPVSGAEDLLKYLSSKYPVYAASNASKERQLYRLKTAGFDKYLKDVFSSEEAGFEKPAKEFFYFCMEGMEDISPSEIMVIGDSVNADIIGAKNFGMKAIWFNFYNETYDSLAFTDYTVTELKDIINIL